MYKKSFDGIDKKFLLPMLSAASVLRMEEKFKDLIVRSKELKISQRKIYEAVLQTYLFAGFPSALISLKILKEFYPVKNRNNENIDLSLMKISGVKTCKKIYGSKYGKLIENIESFSPEMSEWLVVEGYGKVLSRKSLSLEERELCIIGILASLNYEDQLYSHINGAYRLGVKISKIKKTIELLDLLGQKKLSVSGLLTLKKFESQKVKKH